jgi:hypothetical protein
MVRCDVMLRDMVERDMMMRVFFVFKNAVSRHA